MRRTLWVIAIAALAVAPFAAAQEKAASKTASKTTGKAAVKRMADGHPDLQGVYDLAMLTPLERGSGMKPTMTKEEAIRQEKIAASLRQQGDQAIEGSRAAPPKGGDGSPGPAGNVGGYNSGWLDPGDHFNVVDGEIRSSIVIDPPDGKAPPLVQGGAARGRGANSYVLPGGVGILQTLLTPRPALPTSDAGENDPGLERQPGVYDDPERRPLGERCLLGFGSTSGPPILPNYFYNNLHQIVQTPDSVLILTEMVHDARIVRMNAQHLPKTMRFWMGDSVGRWDGDTLVVDTTNFTDKTRFRGSSEDMHVIERFTRADDKSLIYRFTIDDPTTWTKTWTGEYSWPATDNHIYEYACHEGNYALMNIMKGARLREKDEAAVKAAKEKK